jgi:hypothetical protein
MKRIGNRDEGINRRPFISMVLFALLSNSSSEWARNELSSYFSDFPIRSLKIGTGITRISLLIILLAAFTNACIGYVSREAEIKCPKCGEIFPVEEGLKSTAGALITCRDYLFRNVEEDGTGIPYGLYSYFLLGRRPLPGKETSRYLKFYQAYCNIGKLPEFSGVRPEEFNISFWPLKVSSNESLPPEGQNDIFFIEQYDYARAETILKLKIEGIKTTGPFIISSRFPLSRIPQPKEELLVIDLSRIGEDEFIDIVDHFRSKVGGDPKTWKKTFDWSLISIHIYSAIKVHGEGVLYAYEWCRENIFTMKKAFAAPSRTK